MSESNNHLPPATAIHAAAPNGLPVAAPTPSGPRGHVVLAWLAILAVSVAIYYWQNVGKKQSAAGSAKEAAQLIMLEFQIRLYVAIPEFVKANRPMANAAAEKEERDKIAKTVASLNRGGVEQRLAVLIALGELDGPKRALDGLIELREQLKEAEHPLSERNEKALDILTRLYTDYVDGRPNAPTVVPDEREFLEKSLEWFGELALAPANPAAPNDPRRLAVLADARQTLLGGIVIVVVALGAMVVGLFGLLVLVVLAFSGKFKSRIGPAVAHHGVYAETFAVWFVVYFAMAFAFPHLFPQWLPDGLQASVPMILSLVALVWPVARGIPWKQVREDIGLTFGTQPLIEPILGFISYMNALPFLIVGGGFALLLMYFIPREAPASRPFDADPSMAHPLIHQLRNATAADILPYFFLMCVCAPIMEEIVFRGCLYRHLRDATRWWKGGVAFSALVVSLVFAAAHPQGLYAIPVLASLACGFTLAREWRGTLIPAIIAHGLNNSLVLAFAILCLMKR